MSTTSTNLGMTLAEGSDTVDVAAHVAGPLTVLDNSWNTYTTTTQAMGDTAVTGTSLVVARSDHKHAMPSFGTPVAIGTAISAGAAVSVAKSDHVHTIGTGTVDTASLGAGLAVPLTKIDIVGGTTIGAALADGDLFPVYDLSATANRQSAMSRVSTYIESAITGDVTISAHTAAIASGVVVNGDINASAAIDFSKFATLSPGQFLRGSASSVVTAGSLPEGNAVINGDFSCTQRQTMPTTDDSYGHDQWILLLEAANAATVSTETSDVPSGGSRYAAKLTVGSGNNNKFGYFQPIEGKRMWHMRGQTVSLQLKLKTTAAIGDIRVGLVQWTSTEDSVTSDIVSAWGAAATNPTLVANWAFINTPASLSPTTSWATYKLEGQSVSASANNLGVFIWCDDKGTTQTTDYMLITDVQLEVGATCTTYKRLPMEVTRILCQRYYYELAIDTAADLVCPALSYTTTTALPVLKLPARMRAAPTLSVSAVSDWGLLAAGGSSFTLTAFSLNSYVDDVVSFSTTDAGSHTVGDVLLLYGINTSARIRLTAEL